MRARIVAAVSLGTALCGSCTLSEEQAPPLVGPSEASISISLAATPDVLATDGASRAIVTATARDAYGTPLPNLSLRAEILQSGLVVKFGTLSAHNLVTDGSGRATATYTAPIVHGEEDTRATVDIGVTPIGSNFANAIVRTTTIRLVPVVLIR